MSITSKQAQTLGQVVAKARAKKGLSIQDLATQLGVSKGWIGELERGRFLDPSPDRLARIAELLDVEPSRIDRLSKGAVADALPGMRTYFRAKYALTPEQAEKVAAYVERLQETDAA